MTDESDRDKLLAEGPRIAPEPRSADGFAAPTPAPPPVEPTDWGPLDEQPSAAEQPATPKPPLVKARPQGSWGGSSGSWIAGSLFRRLVPLLFVLVLVGRGYAGGSSGWAFAAIWIAFFAVMILIRLRRRGRW